ncbi:MAG TPA: gamma-glutamyltransferase, partial [Candidatus Elarobacter sp.]|nr:gamma-glutamyltransferase [Candidatus Elarobacter sp.]
MIRPHRPLALFVLLIAGCTQAPAPSTAPAPRGSTAALQSAAFPDGWANKTRRAASFGDHAMIATNSPLASEAGVEILKKGGNAVDAAVAVGMALEVTFPYAGNIGGGGFMMIRMANGDVAALDYREVAPLAATRDMYVENGK